MFVQPPHSTSSVDSAEYVSDRQDSNNEGGETPYSSREGYESDMSYPSGAENLPDDCYSEDMAECVISSDTSSNEDFKIVGDHEEENEGSQKFSNYNEWVTKMLASQNYMEYPGGGQPPMTAKQQDQTTSSAQPIFPLPPNMPWFQDLHATQIEEEIRIDERIVAAMTFSRKARAALNFCEDSSTEDDGERSEFFESQERISIPLAAGVDTADIDLGLYLEGVRLPHETRVTEIENEIEALCREASLLGANSLARQDIATLRRETAEGRRGRLRPRRSRRSEEAHTNFTLEAYRQYQKISAQQQAAYAAAAV